jgi:oligoendopeptidase F
MSMELACLPFMTQFYGEDDARRARRDQAERFVTILPWIATIDQFQHWLYTHEGHSRTERQAEWLRLRARFGEDVDWSGLDEAHARMWQRQMHLFGSPFYYIEYGIAQLGALQLYANYQRDPARALEQYKHALALGGSRPLPELFTAAGLSFDFSPARIAATWREVEHELEG